MRNSSPQKNLFYYSAMLVSAWLLGLAGEAIYAPAMPAMAHGFHVPETLIKLTVTYFIFGKTISMFVCSPMAEAFGRRQFILFGLLLFIAGGVLCTASTHIQILWVGRLIQGLGCSIIILMGRAIVNDCFEGGYAAQVFSYIFTGNAIAIFLLPILGGYMAAYLGWRWIFFILSLYGVAVFALLWRFLPQTNPKTNLATLQPSVILNNYKTILRSKVLWGFLLCVAFMIAGEKAYTTSAAFLFIGKLGFSSIGYGYLTAGIWAAHLCATLLAGWLALRTSIYRVLMVGVILVAVPSLAMLLASLWHWENASLFISAMLFYMFGSGFIMVSGAVGIVRPFPTLIGFATAFAMAVEFAIAGGISFLISYHASSVVAIAAMVGGMGLCTLLTWVLLLGQKTMSQSQER
jgi:Bcr/CflA subfamily drug resistance transporter